MTQDDIDEAREIIKETHPLRDIPLKKVFPFLEIAKKFKKGGGEESKKDDKTEPLLAEDEDLGLSANMKNKFKKNLVGKKQKEIRKKMKKYSAKNPYMLFGFGINAFFDMTCLLIWLFAILTLLSIPAIAIFASSNGLENYRNYGMSKFTMGNMGYASSNCFSISMGAGEVLLNCNGGNLEAIASFEQTQEDGSSLYKRGFGIISADAPNKTLCLADKND